MSVFSDWCSVWVDPVEFARVGWPGVYFTKMQRDVMYSCEFDVETYLKSCNQAGKDYTISFMALKKFICCPVIRIVPTSVKDDHLRIFEGELLRWINTCRFPLRVEDGGILKVTHRDVRKIAPGDDKLCPISYINMTVSEKGEGMAGHHAPNTVVIGDEASGLDNQVRDQAQGWAISSPEKQGWWFGNPNPCENFFRKGCDGGDVLSDCGTYYLRRVFTLKAEDLATVKKGMLQERLGLPQDPEPCVPGIMTYDQYKFRRRMWDPMRQCIGLDAEFYTGKEVKLFPSAWVAAAQQTPLPPINSRKGKAIGVDTAEGGDDTVICVVDEHGLLEMQSWKTSDTSVIAGHVLHMASRWSVPVEKVCFDRGGGGKQIADRMRLDGYAVTTVDFNEAVNLDIKRVRHQTPARRENREEKTTYRNRRHEMYSILSDAIDPAWLTDYDGKEIAGATLFHLPSEARGPAYAELIRQMLLVPRGYDENGRLKIPPKRRKDGKAENNNGKRELSLEEIMGCSPDELDALAVAHWRMVHKSPVGQATAVLLS